MALFLSSQINRLDKKGRISVPASFRVELTNEPFRGVVIFKSNAHECLEGFTWSYMQSISERLDDFNLFSEEQDDLAASIFGSAVQLPLDGDGRIILPQNLIEFADLDEKAAFVGMGTKFQIWDPEKFNQRQKQARQNIQKNNLTIPQKNKGGIND
ncbi:MAG: division/cell wall cluster transcriptional repressor MraZ [Pseudomonadota bacterium]